MSSKHVLTITKRSKKVNQVTVLSKTCQIQVLVHNETKTVLLTGKNHKGEDATLVMCKDDLQALAMAFEGN